MKVNNQSSIPEIFADFQIESINSYHETCQDLIGNALQEQGRLDVLKWLQKETQPIG